MAITSAIPRLHTGSVVDEKFKSAGCYWVILKLSAEETTIVGAKLGSIAVVQEDSVAKELEDFVAEVQAAEEEVAQHFLSNSHALARQHRE